MKLCWPDLLSEQYYQVERKNFGGEEKEGVGGGGKKISNPVVHYCSRYYQYEDTWCLLVWPVFEVFDVALWKEEHWFEIIHRLNKKHQCSDVLLQRVSLGLVPFLSESLERLVFEYLVPCFLRPLVGGCVVKSQNIKMSQGLTETISSLFVQQLEAYVCFRSSLPPLSDEKDALQVAWNLTFAQICEQHSSSVEQPVPILTSFQYKGAHFEITQLLEKKEVCNNQITAILNSEISPAFGRCLFFCTRGIHFG